MGCCEKTINILGYQYKISSSSSSSLIGLKETNLSSGAKNDSSISLNKVLKSLLRDKPPNIKVNLNKSNKKKIVLEKIKEEESESKESSINNKKMISKEKLIEIRNSKKLNIISNKNSKKLENIKLLRKNRSHPKFKIKLNEQIFIKKLNEYKNNKTKGNNYINNLSYISQLKESKSEQLFVTLYDKSFDDSCFIDSINKINNEKRNKIIYRNNISSKRNNKGSYIQYYEEEYNKNQLK